MQTKSQKSHAFQVSSFQYQPVLRALLTVVEGELIESPERLCSRPADPGGRVAEGLTDDS